MHCFHGVNFNHYIEELTQSQNLRAIESHRSLLHYTGQSMGVDIFNFRKQTIYDISQVVTISIKLSNYVLRFAFFQVL